MPKKKAKKDSKAEEQGTIVPEGIDVARVRDMANDFNINHSRYRYGNNNDNNKRDKRPHFAIFLGAGASKDSHIKLASEMMEDFKKIILEDEDLTFDTDKARDDWFEEQNWHQESKSKYSCLFQRAYKTDIDRRNYIQDVIAEGEASLGYIILSNFIAEGYVDTIITTNFDDLVYQACTSYTAVRPVVYSLGGFASEMSSMIDRPKVIKIHGDFLFSALKNTETELAEQDPNMSKQVEEILAKYEGLIVVGYKGNDESVINLLRRLPSGHSLYWCEVSRMIKDEPTIELDERVIKLLKDKRGKLVEMKGFDHLMKEILEVVKFDTNIIIRAFQKRQDKLNEELHKFDKVSEDDNKSQPDKTEKKEESFTAKIENVFDLINLRNKTNEAWLDKNYDEQEKLARQIIENRPTDSFGHFNLALALQEKKQNLDEVEANYRKAIELEPNNAVTYNNLGLLLAKDKMRRQEAEENYLKALELDSNYPSPYYNLACLNSLRHKRDEVFGYLKQAVAINSNLKSIARTDSDFDFVHDDNRFWEIIGWHEHLWEITDKDNKE